MNQSRDEITRLLLAHHEGDEEAFRQLTSLVYDDLRRIALRQTPVQRGSAVPVQSLSCGCYYPAQEEVSSMESGARGPILVVEDDAETRLAYRALLEHAGWSVDEASDGEQALRMVNGTLPSLVVIDISLPGVDGWEMTRRLKLDERTRDVPVLLVTGHTLDEDRQRARDLGCAGYLAKPVSPSQLVEEVERLAERH